MSRSGSGTLPGSATAGYQAGGGLSFGILSGPARPAARVAVLPVRHARALDPHAEAAAFPDRWRAYLRAHFRDAAAVAAAFGVSERAAGKWLSGDGACRGDKVAVAVAMHGAAAVVAALFPERRG